MYILVRTPLYPGEKTSSYQTGVHVIEHDYVIQPFLLGIAN
jgi:hypothetical protein